MLILLDYGHGGGDPGAVYKGRREATDVLKLGQAVKKLLVAGGAKVDETRNQDRFLTLEERVKMEQSKKYDLFVSIHRNAFAPEKATGAEVFVYSLAKSKALPYAKRVQSALVRAGFKDRGVKEKAFYVLRHTRAPALLIEVGFIDNSNDNKLFDTKFTHIAEGIANAILNRSAALAAKKVCESCGQIIHS